MESRSDRYWPPASLAKTSTKRRRSPSTSVRRLSKAETFKPKTNFGFKATGASTLTAGLAFEILAGLALGTCGSSPNFLARIEGGFLLLKFHDLLGIRDILNLLTRFL